MTQIQTLNRYNRRRQRNKTQRANKKKHGGRNSYSYSYSYGGTVTVTTENRLVVPAVTIVTEMVTFTTDIQYSFANQLGLGAGVLSPGCGDDCDGSWELPPPCRSRGWLRRRSVRGAARLMPAALVQRR